MIRAACQSRSNRRLDRVAGRDAIVDQDHRLVVDVGPRPRTVGLYAPSDFLLGRVDCVGHVLARHAHRVDQSLVQHRRTGFADGTDGQLFDARGADLSHDDDIERAPQKTGHLLGHHNAAARQTEDDHVFRLGEPLSHRGGQPPPRIPAIHEHHDATLLAFPERDHPHFTVTRVRGEVSRASIRRVIRRRAEVPCPARALP
jgi:hypothetical protein